MSERYYNNGEFYSLLEHTAREVKHLIWRRAQLYAESYKFFRIEEDGEIRGPVKSNEIYARMKLEIIALFSKECSNWHTANYFQKLAKRLHPWGFKTCANCKNFIHFVDGQQYCEHLKKDVRDVYDHTNCGVGAPGFDPVQKKEVFQSGLF